MTNLEKLSMEIEKGQQDCDLKFCELIGQIEKCVNEERFTEALDLINELSEFLEKQDAQLEKYKMEAVSEFMLDLKSLGE